MCLAIAGRIVSIAVERPAAEPGALDRGDDTDLWRIAEVDFGGVRQPVSLACLPQARPGDRVLVHVGIALALVDDDAELP